MAARHPPVGIAHPTVVPENFEPEPREGDDESNGESEGDAHSGDA